MWICLAARVTALRSVRVHTSLHLGLILHFSYLWIPILIRKRKKRVHHGLRSTEVFAADSEKEMHEWIEAIRHVITFVALKNESANRLSTSLVASASYPIASSPPSSNFSAVSEPGRGSALFTSLQMVQLSFSLLFLLNYLYFGSDPWPSALTRASHSRITLTRPSP